MAEVGALVVHEDWRVSVFLLGFDEFSGVCFFCSWFSGWFLVIMLFFFAYFWCVFAFPLKKSGVFFFQF